MVMGLCSTNQELRQQGTVFMCISKLKESPRCGLAWTLSRALCLRDVWGSCVEGSMRRAIERAQSRTGCEAGPSGLALHFFHLLSCGQPAARGHTRTCLKPD